MLFETTPGVAVAQTGGRVAAWETEGSQLCQSVQDTEQVGALHDFLHHCQVNVNTCCNALWSLDKGAKYSKMYHFI